MSDQVINAPKGLPDPLAPDSEKKTNSYGLKYAYVIAQEWFGDGGMITGSCNYLNRRDKIRSNRLLVRGEDDLEYYKGQHKRNQNDLDYLNLDWEQINVPRKFCNIVSNGIGDDNYSLDVRAVDKYSVKLRKQKRDEYYKYMMAKPMLDKAKEVLNLDMMPKGFIPEDEEELNLQMEIKERLKPEIAEEITIDFVKRTNNWDFIEKEKNKDAVRVGLMVARCWTDPNDGVKVDYVDPEEYVHSYVKRNDFSDKYYEGVVDTITISDIKRESDYDEVTLRKIANLYGATNKVTLNCDTCPFTDLLNFRIHVLRFAFKTSKTIVYKKSMRKGQVVKMTRKDGNYNPPERADYGKVSKTLDTWYEGNFIIGSNYLYGYKECENLARDTMNKAMSPFITVATDIYENKLRSFLDDIAPLAKQMQKAHLKIQQLLSELKPDITEIDFDSLAHLGEGEGGTKRDNIELALSLLNVKGVVIKKRIDTGEGGIKDTKAVNVASTPQGSAIGVALNTWGHYYNLIRDVSGINPARDGSLAADALVGVNEMAQLASNTATKDIVDAAIYFNTKVCETISTRINLIYKSKDAVRLRELYNNAVGSHNVNALEAMADRHLHEFGFTLEMVPTQLDRQEFKEALTLALQEGSINVEDKIEAESIARSNMKQAKEYLKYRRRKNIKLKMEQEMALAANKSQNDSAAAQAAEQAKVQGYQAKKMIDLQYEGQLSKIKLNEAQVLKEMELPYEQQKFQQDVYLKKIDSFTKLTDDKMKEDRKDDRTKLQASQQSQLIDQRQKDKQPIDFQNMDDFTEFLNNNLSAL